MVAQRQSRQYFARPVSFENLERRICLDGHGVGDQAACLFEPSAQSDASRATQAINCFAFDLYEHLQKEEGNLFLSPVSIATGLAMAYAGAAGETATEMEEVLHLGTEPGIHESFGALLSSFDQPVGITQGFELETANALWPQVGLPVRDDFVQTIETDYRGTAQTLDYSNPDQAKDVINSWVAEKTRDKIQNLIENLSPTTVMVLTNSIYFKSFWASPFDPNLTDDRAQFFRDDGEVVEVSMMYTEPGGFIFGDDFVGESHVDLPFTELDGFEVLEMPFQGGASSMVFLVPQDQSIANELTPDLWMKVNDWLDGPQTPVDDFIQIVRIPKFETTVSTQLEQLLPGMGMSRAFGDADFSGMTSAPVAIDQVHHKAFLEVNEQGTEAGAATQVSFVICFAEGTPILTPEGEKPIEEIKAGDYVLSRNENNIEGKVERKLVEETFQNHGELVNLQVGGQSIRATREHPFFVKGQGWTKAGDLRAGDLLATDLSSWMEVEQVTTAEGAEPVYNFQVADHHTYFVGREKWGFAIWTHNHCGGEPREFRADRPFHFLIRDNASSALLFMGRVNDPTQTENNLTPTAERIAGDSNGDGRFNSSDLVLAFEAGKYEDDVAGNASFVEGDWNGDGDFTTADLVFAFQNAVYEGAPAARGSFDPIPATLFSTDNDDLVGTANIGKQDTSLAPLDAFFAQLA